MRRRLFLQLCAFLPFMRVLDCDYKQPVPIDLPAGFGDGLSFPGYFLAEQPDARKPSRVTIEKFTALSFIERLFGSTK